MISFAVLALLLASQSFVKTDEAEVDVSVEKKNHNTTSSESKSNSESSSKPTNATETKPLTLLIEKFKRPGLLTRTFNGIKSIFSYPKSLTRVTVDPPGPLHPEHVAAPQVNVQLVKH